MIFAPILMSFLRSAIRDKCFAFTDMANFSFGSKNDLRHGLAVRLECDGKPTFNPEGRLSAVSRPIFGRC